jgi:hypothetical protein
MILKVNIKHADVILPEYTHARFIVTAGDVIHKKSESRFLIFEWSRIKLRINPKALVTKVVKETF